MAIGGLGITVARLPGEYRVKYRNATDATARMAETLDQAVWPAARTAPRGAPFGPPRKAGLPG